MEKYEVKTMAVMEQTYHIEAESEDDAKRIALQNTEEIIEQTQVNSGDIISVQLLEEQEK